MAPMSNQNKLQLVDITKYPELDLKEVENQLQRKAKYKM